MFSLPPAMMYSALMSHSLMVLESPRLSRMGLRVRPRVLSNSKFCMLRAPTWIRSTSSNRSRCFSLIISVTMGSPVALRALRSSSRPSAPIPWKSYGLVRGLKAPPRSSFAPDALTACAMAVICSSDSTEQGPAIMAKLPPPILTLFSPSPISTIVSAGWKRRLAHLNGSLMRVTDSMMSRPLSRSGSILLVSPIRPITVWNCPSLICTSTPWPLIQLIRFFF